MFTRTLLSLKPTHSVALRRFAAWWIFLILPAQIVSAQEIKLLRAKPDPYGYPRPAPNQKNVPVATSVFLQIGFDDNNTTDYVLSDSIAVQIGPRGEPAIDMLKPGTQFANGYRGKVFPGKDRGPAVAVYIDGGADLKPSTTYIVSVSARSKDGAILSGKKGIWEFSTEDVTVVSPLQFRLDLSTSPVNWHGGFFTGFCKPSFCTSASNRIPGYELMERVRKRRPKAWSLQRDFTMTGMERQPGFLSGGLPNVVRERETRRIITMEKCDEGILLRVEDFFGHEQYGISSVRPLSEDYHPGNEVLIADGVHDARAKVLRIVTDSTDARSILVTSFKAPADGWKKEYPVSLPVKENPDAPGLFSRGGCYLSKFKPAGTPHYYWGRLDKEWDIAHRRFGRRLVVNFAEAPGDLSVDGRDWSFPKDYNEYHQVVQAYTNHLIERYHDACLDFVWSVFNEPDLSRVFWRSGDWNELQKFYDYTVDAILRAFEDHGYDSDRVIVGGLEIGAIFGTHIERPILEIFLNHCSPRATCAGALPYNAAFTDKRLDGKRSKRTEKLCLANNGKGSPCDFISIHSYNASEMMAAKVIRAKEIALEIDEEYYAGLWVNSFESCPGWAPPPDVAAADSYLGNGYFPTWCADVVRRQLSKAAQDKRYAFGESIITFWPWPNSNFTGHNNSTRVISVDVDGDNRTDRHKTVAMPILNFLGLLSGMGDTYLVLPELTSNGHVVSGFASKADEGVRVLLYSHNGNDIQSRSKASFAIALDLSAVPWPEVRVKEYRFDKDNNSYYRLGLKLRDRPVGDPNSHLPSQDEVQKLLADLQSGDRDSQVAAVKKAATFGDVPEKIVTVTIKLYEETKHQEVRTAIEQALRQALGRQICYSPKDVAQVLELSVLRVTKELIHSVRADGMLQLNVAIAANGANFVTIEPTRNPQLK